MDIKTLWFASKNRHKENKEVKEHTHN